MVWWYFIFTMLLIFTVKGTDEGKLSLITINGYPNALKFLGGPIIDTYYIKKMGARKTYIIFGGYVIAIIVIVGSFYINEWVENEEIFKIMCLGLACNFIYIFKMNA